jgi:YHS domain-containing protein
MREETRIETDADIEVDPVCGAVVEIEEAAQHALALEYEGREYVFCGPGCRARFEHMPLRYAVAGRGQP